MNLKTFYKEYCQDFNLKYISFPLLNYQQHEWILPKSQQILQPQSVIFQFMDYSQQVPLQEGQLQYIPIVSTQQLQYADQQDHFTLHIMIQLLNIQLTLFSLQIYISMEKYNIENSSLNLSFNIPRLKPSNSLIEYIDILVFFKNQQSMQTQQYDISNQSTHLVNLEKLLLGQWSMFNSLKPFNMPCELSHCVDNTIIKPFSSLINQNYSNWSPMEKTSPGKIQIILQLNNCTTIDTKGSSITRLTPFADSNQFASRMSVLPISFESSAIGFININKEAFQHLNTVNSSVALIQNIFVTSIQHPNNICSLSVEIPSIQDFIDYSGITNEKLSLYLQSLVGLTSSKRHFYKTFIIQQTLFAPASYTISLSENYDVIQLFKSSSFGYKSDQNLQYSIPFYFSFSFDKGYEYLTISPFPQYLNSRDDLYRIQVIEQQKYIFLTQLSGSQLQITDFSSPQANTISTQTEEQTDVGVQGETVEQTLKKFKLQDQQGYLKLKKQAVQEKQDRIKIQKSKLKRVKQLIKHLRDEILFKISLEAFGDACNLEVGRLQLKEREYFLRLKGQAIDQYEKRIIQGENIV
ncbi:hypothetical protein SS50377_27572 [Spironucleus salmonicida]|uniref:Uncharacterized protein n=1 Tax=Spironucleus salmonicida TaxID=348837 RepID=V6LSG4_9EUKA|nr:hypothetical protein SS50377_27572 [Spironucleus salmonicida]|eukprot:EST46651.1 Hypothetical protein SS50377_13454 [Spironucleus salmonicida]